MVEAKGPNYDVMKIYLTILFIAFSFLVQAQKPFLVISGVVKNEKNKALENAHIYTSVFDKGTISDENGFFTLKLLSEETTIIVTHVSYGAQKIALKQKTTSDSLFLRIQMKKKSKVLSEVKINENKRYLVEKENNIWVYDYLLLTEKSLLLLLKDEKKYELKLINEDLGQIGKLTLKKGGRCFLEEDGLGKKYLCKGDSVFQISINSEGIQLYFEERYEPFKDIMGSVVAGNKNYIFFKEYALNHQLITYYGINRKSHSKKLLTQIFDREVYENISYINDQIGILNSFDIRPMQKSYLTRTELDIVRSILHLTNYRDQIAGLPINCPIIQYDTSLYIFNLIENKLEVFNTNGDLIHTRVLKFKNTPYSIEVDPSTGHFYSLCLLKGIVHVDRFDVTSGEVKQTYKLKNYTFPEKIKFRNNHILFLYSDFNFNKKLFNMPLSKLNSVRP